MGDLACVGSNGGNGGAIDQGAPGAAAWPVAIADGTAISVNNFPVTQPVSGPLTDTQLRAEAVPVSGTVVANVGSGTQPVSGTFWQNTQPVSGPLTDTQLRASAVPVSGTFWQVTQPVSGPLTDAQMRASAVPVSIGVALPAGNNNIGDVDVVTLPALTAQGAAGNSPQAVVSLGNSLGKTNVLKTGSVVTTATTADQVVLTYTVTAGKTFYLEYFTCDCRLTAIAATATMFGTFSLETPSGTKVFTAFCVGAGASVTPRVELSEPIPIPASTVIRVVCTPGAVTSYTWQANFGGYEK